MGDGTTAARAELVVVMLRPSTRRTHLGQQVRDGAGAVFSHGRGDPLEAIRGRLDPGGQLAV